MASGPRHEDDGNETEMSGLQSNGNHAEDSEDEHRANKDEDTEQQGADRKTQQDKGAAYRKLYGIVTIMTMFLFALNIAQVCLLPVISSLYWIVLCPGIIFIAFTAWAWIFVASNSTLFFGNLGSFAQGRRRAGQHLGALFLLRGRSERSREYGEASPGWPGRFARAGVFLTMFLNIILTQFIYLPVFAVPAFNDITWKMDLDASHNVSTPSFAVLQNINLNRRAELEDDENSIDQMCEQKAQDEVFQSQYCFRSRQEFTYGDPDHPLHMQWAVFDGREVGNISMGAVLNLWYQYYRNSTASKDQLLSLAVFDSKLLPIFPEAVNCGIIPFSLFPAGDRNQVSLQQTTINDPYNAMPRNNTCRKFDEFKHYNTYDTQIVPLGAPSAPGWNNCDKSENPAKPLNGSCNADITVAFTSTLSRVYTSEHGKDWVTILTEEGGVVGFVTFLTWFFGIFSM